MMCRNFKTKNELNIKVGCKIFPDISDRAFWERAKKYELEFFLENKEEYDKMPKRMLTASLFREYATIGNRANYEEVYFLRRSELVNFVVLECFYNDGRFMNEILDLTWMILEETTWTLPAHNEEVFYGDSLPAFEKQTMDLFLAETAAVMAFVYQVIGKKLDELSPIVTRRIKARLKSDIIDDYLKRDDYWWMGYGRDFVNNWNPWINSNVLAVSLIIEEDEKRLRNVIYKAMEVFDNYFDLYPFDGACDEGPSYWNQAGLSMLENLWLLDIVTDGQVNFFGEEKVINTLEYFMKVYTGNGECVNFADSGAKVPVYYASIYKFAKITGDKKTLSFAKHLYDTRHEYTIAKRRETISKVFRVYDRLRYVPEMEETQGMEFVPELDYYFDSTQVVTSKADMDVGKGLYLAAKGGHNDESHNHNDIGNFIVYKNGIKFIVDSGNMVYSRITFSHERYSLWTNCSTHHNLPTIDGQEQKAGKEYAAKNVKYEKVDNKVVFSLDIKDAYSNREMIEKWVRTIEYNKALQEISVTEDFEFKKEFEYELNFLTPQNTEVLNDGIVFKADNGEELKMKFETSKFEISKEKIELTDEILVKNWGAALYRISIKSKAKNDILTYLFK